MTEERRAQKKAYSHERYEYLKAHGLCVRCKKKKASPGFVQCPDCLEKNAVAAEHRDNSQIVEWKRKTRKRRLEQGLCVECGEAPVPGRRLCIDCSLKRRRYMREYNRKNGQQERISGICIRKGCDEPCVDGKKYCAKHYAEKVEQALPNIMKAHEKMREEKAW